MEPTSVILRRFYTEIWENLRYNSIAEYFQPDLTGNILIRERAVDPKEVREWMQILDALVRDKKVTFLHSIDDGMWCSAFLRISCVSRATDKPVTAHQQILCRQKDGFISESYPQFDLLRFFEQLDQLPEDIDALLMSGTVLR
ncbi:ester cyclase [Tateyamaria sp.]|uniref:ester cyclase n=1 Tax=Tateyamaria sp. TaxID=1929288 RepID=UPI00329F5CEA